MFPQFYYDKILETISSQGVALQHLNLKGVWVKDNPDLLCIALKQLGQLRVLHIPHIANDNVLQCVSNIPYLRVLNISGECQCTKQGLLTLCQELNIKKSLLRVLDIGSYGEENIPHETIAEFIENLPNLATLSSYSFVGKSLNYIYQRNKKFLCNLKYVHDTRTTKQTCEAIYQTCPVLENLYFDTPDNEVIDVISKFQGLHTFKLVKFQCLDLHKLLLKWGSSLQHINISLGRGIFDISKLAQSCPNLTKMGFYKMEFLSHTTDVAICKLRNIEVLYSELTPSCLRYILQRSPDLRKISIGEEVGITDGDLYRLCADFCLLNLEKLWFQNARYLTVNAIELLMSHCPELTTLGRIPGWNVSTEDIFFMRAVIQSTNSDLSLLPEEEIF